VVIPWGFGRSPEERARGEVFVRAMRTCEEFSKINPAFRIRKVVHVGREPLEWPKVREKYEIEQFNRIYLFAGTRRESVAVEDMAVILRPSLRRPDVRPEVSSERVQQAIADALSRVLLEDGPQVLFTQGHGEISIDRPLGTVRVEALRSALANRGYEVGTLDLRIEKAVPERTHLLVTVAGPGFERIRGEARRAIAAHVERGGALLIFLPQRGDSGLEVLLEKFGVASREGLVATVGPNPGGRVAATTFLFCERVSPEHPITEQFPAGAFRAEVLSARALAPATGAVPILYSPDESWLETGSFLSDDPTDPRGPFPLMTASEGKPSGQAGRRPRVVVSGSWTAALDPYFRGDARRLLLNAVYWLTNRDELASASGWRENQVNRIQLSEGVRRAFYWTSFLVLPGCSLLAGIFAFLVRRR
jgi:hypothetical protein